MNVNVLLESLPSLFFIAGVLFFGFSYYREKKNNEFGFARRTVKKIRDFTIFWIWFYVVMAALFLIMFVAPSYFLGFDLIGAIREAYTGR